MTVKQIEAFCHLAETLNFSKAAEKMYITQPAFSRLIVSLEEELECSLFIRSKTQPKLTFAGECIYQRMKVIMEQYSEIYGIARIAKKNKMGSARIGMLDNGLTKRSRELLGKFKKEYPQVALELKEYSEVQMLQALEQDWIDLGFIIHFPAVFQEKLESAVTEYSNECVALYREHPLANNETVRIEDLKNESFVALREDRSEYGFNKQMTACLQCGFRPQISIRTDSVAGAFSAVDCNLGCLIISDALNFLAGDHTVMIPIDGADKCTHHIVWKKDTDNPVVSMFREFLDHQEVT